MYLLLFSFSFLSSFFLQSCNPFASSTDSPAWRATTSTGHPLTSSLRLICNASKNIAKTRYVPNLKVPWRILTTLWRSPVRNLDTFLAWLSPLPCARGVGLSGTNNILLVRLIVCLFVCLLFSLFHRVCLLMCRLGY